MTNCTSRHSHFAVLHRGPGGQGTGYTIVTARDTNMARHYVWLHLTSKAEGHTQCGSRNLLEVMSLDESMFADFEVPADTLGVHCEFYIGDDETQKPIVV